MPELVYDFMQVFSVIFMGGFILYFAYKFSKVDKNC